jgi:heat-inducible transcriptional repressor
MRRCDVLEDRRLEVLRAIVEEFVSTNEPVGSKALTERRGLAVSPATVRNDMAALEDEGYITQPHTSAGRVPTDKGYRLFVDRLSTVKPLSAAERRAIENFLQGAVDTEDVLRRSVRLLAQLTRQVAVVQYPVLSRSAVRHVEVVDIGNDRLLLVLITDTGRVEQRVVDAPAAVDDDAVAELRRLLNVGIGGHLLVDAPSRLADLPDQAAPLLRPLVSVVTASLLEAVVERPEERIVLAGTANLTRHPTDFPGSLHSVLEALEEQVVLLKLVGAAAAGPGTVSVSIGAENDLAELRETSVVRSGYGAGLDRGPLAGIGIVGPTRMDYPNTMAQVRAVAKYVGELLAGGPLRR